MHYIIIKKFVSLLKLFIITLVIILINIENVFTKFINIKMKNISSNKFNSKSLYITYNLLYNGIFIRK